jgi:stearoyl-CoA desaturase (delta-9 desaturase)
MQHPKERPWNWPNILFLAFVHVVAIGGTTVYLVLHGPSLAAVLASIVWAFATTFSISAGYHRLFSHRAYEAHPMFRFFLLLFGAAAFQNSALEWALDHRVHHARVDSDADPYSIRQGFWYAHMGWIFRRSDPSIARPKAPDLRNDRLIRWQARDFLPLAVVMSFLLPLGLGFLFGDPWGFVLLAGFLRLVLVLQVTFCINSVTHSVGSQPYSRRDSSRDSLLAALLTMGEGYHNYHHTFPNDYRNGVGRHQFDPTKWILRALVPFGLTANLRRASPAMICRARMQVHGEDLARRGVAEGRRAEAIAQRRRIDDWAECWSILRAEVERALADRRVARGYLRLLRRQLRGVRREIGSAYASWRRLMSSPHPESALA